VQGVAAVAARAGGHPATFVTQEHGAVTASVEEQEDLFVPLEVMGDRLDEER